MNNYMTILPKKKILLINVFLFVLLLVSACDDESNDSIVGTDFNSSSSITKVTFNSPEKLKSYTPGSILNIS